MTVPESRSRTLIEAPPFAGPRSWAFGPCDAGFRGRSSPQHALHDLLGDRRGHRAALARRALDGHRDGHAGVLDRREADERDLVARRAGADLRRAGLAGDVDALQRGGRARALLDDAG